MSILNSPDAILLDMDNTIYDYCPCHNAGLAYARRLIEGHIRLTEAEFLDAYGTARSFVRTSLEGQASSHNRLLYFQRMLEGLDMPNAISLALSLYDAYWEAFIDKIKLHSGVMEFLAAANQASIPVAIVTDLTADVQFRKISRLGIEGLIHCVVTSEEAGRDKPNAEMFESALRKARCQAKTVWVIGDNHDKDMAGGKTIGAVTFLKRSTDGITKINPQYADFQFDSFFDMSYMLYNSLKKQRQIQGDRP